MFSPRLEIDTDGSSSEVPISGDDVNPFLYRRDGGTRDSSSRSARRDSFVHALYSYGLSNLDKTGTAEVRPSALNLLVGFRF